MTVSLRRLLLLLLVAGLASACGGPSVSLNEDPSKYEEQVDELEAHLADNPDDTDALRTLGTILMRTNRPARAYDLLKKAYAQDPEDPQTMFFLGLASEGVGKRKAALRLFQNYDEMPRDSEYRTLMEGRYAWLVRLEARDSVQRLIANEKQLADREPSPRIVAVLPFQFQGGEDRFQPLGRGLAEMVTVDLTHVQRLRLVERVRLQALLDELELAQSKYVDPSTAPRVGKLLGAGRLIGGSYLVTQREQLRLDLTLASLNEGSIPEVGAQTGDLARLFALQKQVVFRVLDLLDIELTPQERDAIDEVPTRNLQAFLAYSRGLLEEDEDNFEAASQFYREAQQLDPNFEAASERASRTESMTVTAGSRAKAIAAGVQTAARLSSQRMRSMVGQRLEAMSGFRGRGMQVPDRRNLTEQTTNADDVLPLPPPAPPVSSSTSSGGGS
jgi:tetratricopeptide (TPR) repeat protein